MATTASTKVYFPGLNGARAIAALVVLISHVELYKSQMGLPAIYDQPWMHQSGSLAVTFFFVLSGFLVTYLLLTEQELSGTIAVGKFYMRRLLRIWPLYYFTMLLGLVLIPELPGMQNSAYYPERYDDFSIKVLMNIFMLPEVAMSIYSPVMYIYHAWSIGVEEKFYLIWPALLKRLKGRGFLISCLAIIIGGMALKYFFAHGMYTFGTEGRRKASEYLFYIFFHLRFECMAIGALFAWVLYKKMDKLLGYIYSPITQLSAIGSLAYLQFFWIDGVVYYHTLWAVLFGIVILNIGANPSSLIKLEHPWMNYLGKVSYGIYMLHPICLMACIAIFSGVLGMDFTNYPAHILLYAFSILTTLAVCSLSYYGLEMPFLKKKKAYSVVAT